MFYIGVTDDIERRVIQHNSGVSKWTKRYAGSWSLAYTRKFTNLSDARKFENLLKLQKGCNAFYQITSLIKSDFMPGS